MSKSKRLACFVALLAAVGGSLLSPAPARADAVAVGGGAAAIQFDIEVQSPLGLDQDIPVSLPFVVLPPEGSPHREASLVSQTVGPVTAHGLRATTEGRLDGHPYAASTASIADVTIQGTNIKAISSECTWDTTGVRATSTIYDANGTKYTPAPDTPYEIPGVGTLVLNHQVHDNIEIAPGQRAEVIYVIAAHLYPFIDANPAGAAFGEIALAFSSCDPVTVPGVPVLKLKPISFG